MFGLPKKNLFLIFLSLMIKAPKELLQELIYAVGNVLGNAAGQHNRPAHRLSAKTVLVKDLM